MYIEGSKDLESLPEPGGLFCVHEPRRKIAGRAGSFPAAHVFGASVTYYRMYSVRVKRGGIEHGKDPF